MTDTPERTPTEQLWMFILIWMGCFLFFQLLSAGLLLLVYGPEVYEMVSSANGITPENINLIRFLQIILSIGIFGIPPLVFRKLRIHDGSSFFRLNRLPRVNLTLLTVIIIIVSAPIIQWALEINQQMEFPARLNSYLRNLEEQSKMMMETLLTMNSSTDFAINFLMIAIIPAFVEELLFRGTLQPLLQKSFDNAHIAIILTGMFFSFIHFQFYGFFPRMLLGILFGYLFHWSGNLWLPILAHFINNGVQVVMVYLFQSGRISIDIDKIEAFPPYITMISTVLLMAAVYIFDLVSRQETATADGKRLG